MDGPQANDDLRLQNANLTTTRSDGGNATEASSRIGVCVFVSQIFFHLLIGLGLMG